jgi:hypothetical protein
MGCGDNCGCGHGAASASTGHEGHSHGGHSHGASFGGGTSTAVQIEAPTTTGVQLTDVAAAKVKNLLEQEGRQDLAPRAQQPPHVHQHAGRIGEVLERVERDDQVAVLGSLTPRQARRERRQQHDDDCGQGRPSHPYLENLKLQ